MSRDVVYKKKIVLKLLSCFFFIKIKLLFQIFIARKKDCYLLISLVKHINAQHVTLFFLSYAKGHHVYVTRVGNLGPTSFRKLTFISFTLPVHDNLQRHNLTITFFFYKRFI